MIFSININGNIVDWCYNLDCQDKQYHKTWIPKSRDIQIITKDLNGLTISEVKKIILEDMQPDINMVKEHNNKLARARRMGEMTDAIQLKMSEWNNKGDDVSMFKFASMLFITAPDGKEKELQDIVDHAEYLATNINDIELARAKKEIQQLLEE